MKQNDYCKLLFAKAVERERCAKGGAVQKQQFGTEDHLGERRRFIFGLWW